MASWEGCCLDGAPSALLSLIPTREGFSSPGSETGASRAFPSGMMFGPSTATHGEEASMSSPGVSPARTSAAQESELESMARARACGLRWRESLAKFGLRLSLSRTPRALPPEALGSSSATFPPWGMMLNGEYWELATSTPRTDATASGLLPTPTTVGNELSPSMQKWGGHRRLLEFLPTPTARSYGYNQGGKAGRVGPKRPSINTLARGLDVLTLREWMMGWPIGWTAQGPLETGRFLEWQRSHGESWGNRSMVGGCSGSP